MAQTNNNEPATNITARINVMDAVPNVDINYGPYNSAHEAYLALSENEAIAVGLTVGVMNNGTIQEYWFKSGTEEVNLVPKATQDYNALENKPKIGTKTLDSSTTLSDIGAASASELSAHTANAMIHVPMTYDGTITAITGFKIEGEKMTITVGAEEYSYRLTEWKDIADFYMLYGKVTMDDNDNFQLLVGNENKPFDQVTGEDLISLATTEAERNGYVVGEKESFTTKTYGTLQVDYQKEITDENTTAIFVLYRKSGTNLPTLGFMVGTNIFDDDLVYNQGLISGAPNKDTFNTELSKNDVVIGETRYYLKTAYSPGNYAGNTYAINFQKQ